MVEAKNVIEFLNLVGQKYTGEVHSEFNGLKLKISQMINGKVVSTKEWQEYLFSNKVENIINE